MYMYMLLHVVTCTVITLESSMAMRSFCSSTMLPWMYSTLASRESRSSSTLCASSGSCEQRGREGDRVGDREEGGRKRGTKKGGMRWTERRIGRERDGRQGERRGERGEGNIDTNQLLSFSRSAFNRSLNKHKHSQHGTSCSLEKTPSRASPSVCEGRLPSVTTGLSSRSSDPCLLRAWKR